MKDLVAIRHKYWSEEKSLWPAKKSTVAVPFCWEGFKINPTGMTFASCFAKNGSWDEANYWLTSAYKGGPENDAFWNQFI